jgi:hypothetical protein
MNYQAKWISTALIAVLLQPWLAQADNAAPSSVQLIEVDDADCAVNDGKLITLTNTEPQSGKVVWIDRWYLDKQTADHTKHVLDREHPSASLGCSITRAGNQHWTIYSVADLPG